MLKKDLITKLATLLKVDATEFETALTSTEEVDVTIQDLHVLTPEELSTRDANSKKNGYTEGKTASIEMFVKDSKEKFGVEFDGKDPLKLIEAIQTKTLSDAKIEPSKKIEELNGVITKLQGNLTAFETEKTTLLSQIEATKTDAKLLKYLPKNRLSTFNDEEYLTIIKKDHEIVTEDGKLVVKKGGEIVRNATTQAPLEVNEVISNIFTERKWISDEQGGQGGRGGQGSKGSGGVILKRSELDAKFTSEGKSLLGKEYFDAVASAVKENPSFDMNA